MTSIAVISPKCSKDSAKRLAELVDGKYLPANRFDYTNFDVVFNYGSSQSGAFNKVINNPKAVKLCVNKISTLRRVANGVQWTKDPEVALSWLKKDGVVVSRATETGNRSEGTSICYDLESWKDSPAKFWTRYFDHEYEVRINVWKDTILSVFKKVEVRGEFKFVPLKITGEHPQVTEMINSIKHNIGIDFYGMDILVNKAGDCKLLEINSGATLHDETEKPLVTILKKEFS